MEFQLTPPTLELPRFNRTIRYRKRWVNKEEYIPLFQTVDHTPELYQWRSYKESHFLVTSHDGPELQEYLEEDESIGILPEEIIESVALAVHNAHEIGIYHTDIHPKNICIQGGDVTVIDWFDAYTTTPFDEPLFCTWCPPEVIDVVGGEQEQTTDALRRIGAYQIGKLINTFPENEYAKTGVGEELTREDAGERLLVSEFVSEYL